MIQYGLIAAGAVSRSLIARLPDIGLILGPVVATSYRVASRIANSLRAGTAARNASELNRVRVILFTSDPRQVVELANTLLEAAIDWRGRILLICDCDLGNPEVEALRLQGASVAWVKQFGLVGRYAVLGDPQALREARAFVQRLRGRAIAITEQTEALFEAGLTMGTALLTPLLERTAQCFRAAGMRDKHALELASALFDKTTRAFEHSGRQSWVWYLRAPDRRKLLAQVSAVQRETDLSHAFLRDLISAYEAAKVEREPTSEDEVTIAG